MLIPFKGGRHKTRLSTVLDRALREEFSLLMLGEVLDAVVGAGLGKSCYVVSSHQRALGLARSRRMTTLQEAANGGVNAAVLRGMSKAVESEFLVIPADLPLLSSSDLDRVIALKSEAADIVISPSRAFDGTNLLFFSREKRVRLSYDRNSFWNHVEDVAKEGYSLAVYAGWDVLFDVDTAQDMRELAKARTDSRSVVFAKEALMRWDSS